MKLRDLNRIECLMGTRGSHLDLAGCGSAAFAIDADPQVMEAGHSLRMRREHGHE